jgi:tyrosyl-tRNA synthetase
MAIDKDVAEQFTYLKKGSVEIIQEDELKAKLGRSLKDGRPLKVKAGFDPTAPDLHVGHTVLLRKMKHYQDLGHEVIFLIGDFTGLIGDPSGRSKTRPAMTREEIDANAETYKEQVFKILDPKTTIIDFNARWLGALTSFEIMKLMAKYTVARILERDDFANRLSQGHPISTHELLYPLMQAYDSVALEADVEMGGTDQKFNLLVGRDIQREYGQEPQIVHTMPLLEGLDGVEKMSKSLDNYVGITEPPQEIFGKVMSVSDPLMYRYYELLTDVPQAEIEAMQKRAAEGEVNPRDLKVELARKIVSDFWGRSAAQGAAEEFERIFTQREVPTEMEEVEIPKEKISLLDLLSEYNLLPSRGEAKRLIRQGGIYLDGQRTEDITLELDLRTHPEIVIKIGKKRFYRITRTQD